MPLRFEAWTLPGSSTFEKRFDIPVAMPGSSGVRELSNYADESILVPASYSRLSELVGTTDGSLIRVYHRDSLIDEFDASRVSLTAGRPNTRTISGPQRNGLVEGIAIAPFNYPNHRVGAMDHIYGGENLLPDLSLGALDSIKEVWEISTDATGGTWNIDVDGDDVDIAYNATAGQVEGSGASGTGIQGLSTVDDVSVSGSGVQEIWELYTDATGGSFDVDFGSGDVATINDGDSAANVKSALEGTDAVTEVSVSGSGTSGDPWVIDWRKPGKPPSSTLDDSGLTGGAGTVTRTVTQDGDPWIITFYVPADPGSVTRDGTNLTGGSLFSDQLVAGDLDPSPVTVAQPIDTTTDPHVHGTYGDPALQVNTSVVNSGSDYSIEADIDSGFGGNQVVVSVTPGQTYSEIGVPVRINDDGRVGIIIRDRFENELLREFFDVSADTWTDLEASEFTVPEGMSQVIFRVSVDDDDTPITLYTDWQQAYLKEGQAETTWTEILTDFIGYAQDRSTGDWLEGDWNEGEDSLGTSLSDIAYTLFIGDNVHLGTALEDGRKMGYQWQVVPADDALVITPQSTTTHVLQVYYVDADEIEDLTSTSGGPTLTVGAKGTTEAQIVSRRIPYTTLIGLGAGALSAEDSDTAAETALGRIEKIVDVERLSSSATLTEYLDAQTAERDLNLKAATAKVLETATQLPLVDYGPGSKVWWQFPGILDKEARPVKSIGWTHGRVAEFEIQGSRILTGDAALVAAVDFLLRQPGRRRSKDPVAPITVGGGGGMAHVLIVSDSEPAFVQAKADYVVVSNDSATELQAVFDVLEDQQGNQGSWSIWMAGEFDLHHDVSAPSGSWIRGLGYTQQQIPT